MGTKNRHIVSRQNLLSVERLVGICPSSVISFHIDERVCSTMEVVSLHIALSIGNLNFAIAMQCLSQKQYAICFCGYVNKDSGAVAMAS